MRILSASIIIFLLVVSCNDGSTGNRDSSVADDFSTSENSISEIAEQTERLQNASPSEETVSHYSALIVNHINEINKNISITDSLFALLDSSLLKESSRYNIDRTRLMYLCVLRDVDNAERITRTVFSKNNPENLDQNYIDFQLNYYLIYIKGIKNECDSAELYRDHLNSVVEHDPTAFYDFQHENHKWINSWLSEQCN